MKPLDHQLDANDLIAYHLHELSPRQQRSVRRILQQNAALAAESEAIAATLRAFPKQEAALSIDAALRERTWLALLPSLAVHLPEPAARFSGLRRWSLPVLAGTAFAATALLVSLHYARRAQPSTVATMETRSSTVPALSPSTGSNAALSSGMQPNAFTSRARAIHRAFFPSSAPPSSAPIEAETETAKNSPPVFPGESTAPLAPIAPSSAATGIASTGSTASLLSNPAQNQSSAQLSAQPSVQRNRLRRTSVLHRLPPTELTLGILGDLTLSHSSTYDSSTPTSGVSESLSQAPTPAVGALTSLRQQPRRWLGYRVTATYTGPTFIDSYKPTGNIVAPGVNGQLNITRRIYEFSGTYVVRGPNLRRLTTSVEAGTGLLTIFSADTTDYPVTHTHAFRPAAVLGVGSELALTKHWGLRAEYRALLYKPPAFNSAVGESVPSGSLTFSSNPILGITYRFGAKGDD